MSRTESFVGPSWSRHRRQFQMVLPHGRRYRVVLDLGIREIWWLAQLKRATWLNSPESSQNEKIDKDNYYARRNRTNSGKWINHIKRSIWRIMLFYGSKWSWECNLNGCIIGSKRTFWVINAWVARFNCTSHIFYVALWDDGNMGRTGSTRVGVDHI